MEPTHIFYKELAVDQDKIFTANIPQNNEVENIKFSNLYNYGITGMSIKPDAGSYSFNY